MSKKETNFGWTPLPPFPSLKNHTLPNKTFVAPALLIKPPTPSDFNQKRGPRGVEVALIYPAILKVSVATRKPRQCLFLETVK